MLLKGEKLPNNRLNDGMIRKFMLEGIDEISIVKVDPYTMIKEHGHEEGVWEVWVFPEKRQVCICTEGNTHQLENDSFDVVTILAIKGSEHYTYTELNNFFSLLGYRVFKGLMTITD